MSQPSNAVLHEKIKGMVKLEEQEFKHIRNRLADIVGHLEKLNGQNKENTDHRVRQTTINRIFGALLAIVVAALINMIVGWV